MNTYVVLLFHVCISIEAYEYSHYSLSPNVGTVLFQQSDLNKERWTKAEISLLRARRHFQKVIPSPASLQTSDANFVNKLIKYFHNTYSSVKREAADQQTDRIMTTALSDAIGGYLKLWVLPIAKYGYYGGTVNQQDILKLYEFYHDIKSYLHTDGTNWRRPDGSLMKTLTINIAPLKRAYSTRSMRNPCEHLAFFEKTDSGLSIPMPYVNWNAKSSTMFVPLKNESLVNLALPNSTTALFKYHDVAKNCIERSKPADQNNFEDKFQYWLNRDIVPHLEDDSLYLGLWSVLSLMNKTGEAFDLSVKPTERKDHRIVIGGYTVDFAQKKVLLLIAILVVEVAWCIPAMIYMICKRKRAKEREICLMIESASENDFRKPRRHPLFEDKNVGSDHTIQTKKPEKKTEASDKGCQGTNSFPERRIRHVDVETNEVTKTSVALDSGIHYSTKMCATESIIIRKPATPKSSPHKLLKKIDSVDIHRPSNQSTIIRKSATPKSSPHKLLKKKSSNQITDDPCFKLANISHDLSELSIGEMSSCFDMPLPPTCMRRDVDLVEERKPQIKEREKKHAKERNSSQVKERDKCFPQGQAKVSRQVKEKDKCFTKARDSLQINEKDTSQIKERCFVKSKQSCQKEQKEKPTCVIKEKDVPKDKPKCILVEKRSPNMCPEKLKRQAKEKDKPRDCSEIFKEDDAESICPCPRVKEETSEESVVECPCANVTKESPEEQRCLCTPCYASCQYLNEKKETSDCCQTEEPKTALFKKTRFRVQNEIIQGKKKPEKCEIGRVREKAHYVEVRIDRPGNEITVGFGGKGRGKALDTAASMAAAAASKIKSIKPSKIPKRTSNDPCYCSSPVKSSSPSPVRKSLIPQPKRCIDDIAIKSKKASEKDKLNVTL